MDDRISHGLYLEMTDTPAGSYAQERVPEVLAAGGVERATWWRNMKRDRDDLPRHLPEFDVLGVYEVGAGFLPPDTPDGISGHGFVRTPRPGQGSMRGSPTVGLSLVLISPRQPDQAQRLRDWADFVHIRHIAEAAVPGMTMITPYVNAAGVDPLFMHFYEMDDADAEATFKRMTPLVTKRFGGMDTPEWKAWAGCPELRIMYVNSFTRVGASS